MEAFIGLAASAIVTELVDLGAISNNMQAQ